MIVDGEILKFKVVLMRIGSGYHGLSNELRSLQDLFQKLCPLVVRDGLIESSMLSVVVVTHVNNDKAISPAIK